MTDRVLWRKGRASGDRTERGEVFRGEFPKVPLRLTPEDVYGQKAPIMPTGYPVDSDAPMRKRLKKKKVKRG